MGSRCTFAFLAVLSMLLAACASGPRATTRPPPRTPALLATAPAAAKLDPIALRLTMRRLWVEHMEYDYLAMNAYFHNQAALEPTLVRLYRNQRDIGAAIVPFYGKAAGDKLAALLTGHIALGIPVVEAAQSGNQAALDKALHDWYAQAKVITDFLSAANPQNWPRSVTEPMLNQHITDMTGFSVALMQGHYAQAIKGYDKAIDHTMLMADALTAGLIAQFADRFCASACPAPAHAASHG